MNDVQSEKISLYGVTFKNLEKSLREYNKTVEKKDRIHVFPLQNNFDEEKLYAFFDKKTKYSPDFTKFVFF